MDGTGAAGTALTGRPAPARTRPGSASRRRAGRDGKLGSERMASGRFGSVGGRSPGKAWLGPRRIGGGPAPLRARVRLRDGNRRQVAPGHRSISARQSRRSQRVADASFRFGVAAIRLEGRAWNCGNGHSPVPLCPSCPVHPRVGGERKFNEAMQVARDGSSPRGRGTRSQAVPGRRRDRFIPAWAGNAASAPCCAHLRPVHPRVGGERRAAIQVVRPNLGSSPRGRGTQPRRQPPPSADRFIPAWAGNAPTGCCAGRTRPVHPRVGGERNCP